MTAGEALERGRGPRRASGASSTTPASTPTTTRSPRPRCRSGTRSCGSTCWAPPPSRARSGRRLAEAGTGGRIINLGSIAGLTGLPNIGPYNASKAALDALTRTLAVELGPAGVLCNSVAPGTIATEMVEGLMTANPALRERLVAKSPLGRIGDGRRGGLADRLPPHRRRQLHHRPDAGGRRRAARRRLGGPVRIVVCGAGTAGCVTAARLSEDPANEVVLLEVGPHYRPGEWPVALTHSHRIIKETHDWGYLARAGRLAADRPRAPRAGGGGLLGHQRRHRPARAPRALRRVGRLRRRLRLGDAGCPGSARSRPTATSAGRRWHGDAGPIPISRYPRAAWLELQERFAEAALSVGHAWIDDHNAPGALGIGPIPLNMLDGLRQTPADRYLDPALGAAQPLPARGRAGRPRRLRAASGPPASRSSAPTGPRRSPPTR